MLFGATRQIETLPDGSLIIRDYHKDGSLCNEIHSNSDLEVHHDHGPAMISYREDGSVASEGYYQYGKLHRDDGPAHRSYYPDGLDQAIEWYQENILHRGDGPALESWFDSGQPMRREYRHQGELHRPYAEGPALEQWLWNGEAEPTIIEFREHGLRPQDLSPWTDEEITRQVYLLMSAHEYCKTGFTTTSFKGLTADAVWDGTTYAPTISRTNTNRLAYSGVMGFTNTSKRSVTLAHLTRQIRLRQQELSHRQTLGQGHR
jgi:hypothetical protein